MFISFEMIQMIFFAFSDVIKMPHTEELKNELQIEWIPMVK